MNRIINTLVCVLSSPPFHKGLEDKRVVSKSSMIHTMAFGTLKASRQHIDAFQNMCSGSLSVMLEQDRCKKQLDRLGAGSVEQPNWCKDSCNGQFMVATSSNDLHFQIFISFIVPSCIVPGLVYVTSNVQQK